MKLRSLTVGLSLLATGTIIGASTQQFVSADVSSGDRPVLVPIETCRIADTRPAPDNVGPKSTPLAAAETILVSAQQAGTDCTGRIPPGATALSLNVTALNATSNSFLTIWSEGPRPDVSALNPAPGQRVFNAVTTELNANQTFQIYNNRGNVDVFVDVNGYYEHHNHDDRYYTETETDAALATKVDAADLPETFHVSVDFRTPPSIVRSSPGISLSQTVTGLYNLTFPRDITACFWNATLGGGERFGGLSAVLNDLGIAASLGNTGAEDDPDAVLVSIYNATPDFANAPFMLTVTCP